MQLLSLHFIPLPQTQGVLGVNLSTEKQVTPSVFKRKTSAGRVPGGVREGSLLAGEGAKGMCASEVRTNPAGCMSSTSAGLRQGRGVPALLCLPGSALHCYASQGRSCSSPCTAVVPPRAGRTLSRAAACCGHSPEAALGASSEAPWAAALGAGLAQLPPGEPPA